MKNKNTKTIDKTKVIDNICKLSEGGLTTEEAMKRGWCAICKSFPNCENK